MDSLMQTRRRIIASQPHIETVSSGNTADSAEVARFNTDLSANIKKLKVTFSPVQSGSGTPNPSNIRAISGHSTITVTRAGVNLLKVNQSLVKGDSRGITYTCQLNSDNQTEAIIATGTTEYDNAFRNLDYANGQLNWVYGKIATCAYSPQANIYCASNPYAGATTIDGEWVDSFTSAGWKRYVLSHNDAYTAEWHRIQIYPYVLGTNVDTVIYPMVCLDSDLGCEFEPYKGQTITVTLPKECYGGYVDLNNGTLVVTKGKCVVDENNGITTVGDAGNGKVRAWCYLGSEKLFVRDVPPICDRMTYTNKDYSGHYSASVGAAGEFGNATAYPNSLWFWLPYQGTDGVQDATVAGVKAYLKDHPMTFIGNLETPQTYQLTPQTLKTLRGVNNVWSHQGTIELQYWTH